MDRKFRLFVYSTLLSGEADHALLANAEFVGPARTTAEYDLYEVTNFGAMVARGKTQVAGELYLVDAPTLGSIDVKKGHPTLFRREAVTLADGTTALAYLMTTEQVRARRRVRSGDWRRRFEVRRGAVHQGPWAERARSRVKRS